MDSYTKAALALGGSANSELSQIANQTAQITS